MYRHFHLVKSIFEVLSMLKEKDKLRPAGGDTTISCNKSDKRKKSEKFNQTSVSFSPCRP